MGIGSWETLPPKELILIAIPHTGLVVFDWAINLRILQPPVPFNIISNKGLPIDRARCELVRQAKSMNATHLFFLDSDVVMPHDGLLRLYNWKMPVVCGIYGSKHEAPGIWIEQSKSGQERYAAVSAEALEKYPLFTHPDIVAGAGCCLVDMQVFNRIEEPFFEWTQGRQPHGVSEDFYFFEKIRKAGIPIHIDMNVKCRHIDFCALDWKGKRERLI